MAIDLTFHQMGTCRWATISHSFEANGQFSTAGGNGFTIQSQALASSFWLQGMLGPRFEHPTQLTGKYGGQPTSTFVTNADAFVAECRANKVNTAFIIGICNDGFSTLAAMDAVMANLLTVIFKCTAAGIRVVITDDAPAGNTFIRSAASLRQFGRYREWAAGLARLYPLILFVPIYHRLVASGSIGTTGVPNTLMFHSDQLHPNKLGHFTYAYEIYKVLDKIFPVQSDIQPGDQSYLYNATAGSENKRGNMLANGMFGGDAGSGVATSWTNPAAGGGITRTCTKGSDADGAPYQQIAYTGTPDADGTGHAFRQDPSAGTLVEGDKHRGSVYILIKKSDAATGYTNLRGVNMSASHTTSSPSNNYVGQAGEDSVEGDVWPQYDWSEFNGGKGLYYRTPESEITGISGSPFSRFSINTIFDQNATGAIDAVIQLRQAKWVKTYAVANY